MSESLDILNIDTQIRKSFDEEHSKLPIYNKKLEELCDTIANLKNIKSSDRITQNLKENEDNLNKYIKNLEQSAKIYAFEFSYVSYENSTNNRRIQKNTTNTS